MLFIKRTYDATEANHRYPEHIEYLCTKETHWLVNSTEPCPALRVYTTDEVKRLFAGDAYKRRSSQAFKREAEWAKKETARGNWVVKCEWVNI